MNFNLTPVVKNLLIVNLAFYFLGEFFPAFSNELSLYFFESSSFKPWQPLTHMFMHYGFMHLFSNMFSLFMFGPMLENVWGPKRFLTFYIVCGLGASFLYTCIQFYEFEQLAHAIERYKFDPDANTFGIILHHDLPEYVNAGIPGTNTSFAQFAEQFREHPDNQTLIEDSKNLLTMIYNSIINNSALRGASGAVFGILLAFGMLFPNTELIMIFFPIPIKAKYFVAIYGFYELYAGVARTPGDNVAHFAHIGGMIFAFILIKYWQRQRNNFY
jgi:membrane associated rhomboid family serine protease